MQKGKREEQIKEQITEQRKKEKAKLRKRILKSRNAISPEAKRLWDERIFANLKAFEKNDPCAVYLCYVSYKSEVSTEEWIDWCLREGKAVFVPKVLYGDGCAAGTMERCNDCPAGIMEKGKKADRLLEIKQKAEHGIEREIKQKTRMEMEFYRIFSLSELRVGYQGILEPEGRPERAFSAWAKQTDGKEKIRMLLPGAVFDRKGNRIGYGGGFYDRWLGKWEKAQRVGLAYQLQLAEEVPVELFDQKMDFLITEEGLIKCADWV